VGTYAVLIADILYPFCGASSDTGPSSTPLAASITPASTISASAVATPAQYTPILTGILAVLRNSGYINISRVKAINAARVNTTAITARTPNIYKFNIRVAHASFIKGKSKLDYRVWTEGWTVALVGSATTTFWRLKEYFRSVFQV
jgi:hypothetical protein